MADAASIIGALSNTGLEYYAAANGQPISVSNVGGVTSATVGSPFAGSQGTVIIIAIAVAVIVLIFYFSEK